MSDVKKPHNAANAMFGLNDAPASPERPRPKQEEPAPGAAGGGPAEQSAGYSGAQPPSISFGPRRAAPATSAPAAQGHAQSGGPQPRVAPSTPPPLHRQTPQYAYPPAPSAPSGSGMKWLVAVLLVIAVVALALAATQRLKFSKQLAHQADQISALTRRADSADDRYAQLSAQFQVTAERLGLTRQELSRARELANSIEKQQQQSVRRLNAAIAEKASATQVNQLQSASNQKFGQLSGSIAGTQKDLDATKEALTGAKGELSGAIARTHAELVELAHRTDRDYFEFHIRKGARQRIGSLQVQLTKTNTKHNLFTVNLFFDDKVSQRKDEAIDEPVFFYMEGAPSALELVVNKLGKNVISGYVSAPKGFIPNATNVLTARPNS